MPNQHLTARSVIRIAAAAQRCSKAPRQYTKNDCGNAVASFEEFLRLHPENPKSPQALSYIGECYFNRGEYAIAVSEFGGFSGQYEASSLAPMALYRVGPVPQASRRSQGGSAGAGEGQVAVPRRRGGLACRKGAAETEVSGPTRRDANANCGIFTAERET
jgi:hypothetical protein